MIYVIFVFFIFRMFLWLILRVRFQQPKNISRNKETKMNYSNIDKMSLKCMNILSKSNQNILFLRFFYCGPPLVFISDSKRSCSAFLSSSALAASSLRLASSSRFFFISSRRFLFSSFFFNSSSVNTRGASAGLGFFFCYFNTSSGASRKSYRL